MLSSRLAEAVRTPPELEATGNCYEDCASDILLPGARHRGWNLVHGRPTLQRPPYVQFGHAWLEKGEQVFDPTTNTSMTRSSYYALGKIDHRDNLVYTSEEARRFILVHGNWGPWEGVDADGGRPDPRKKADIERRHGPLKRTQRSKKPKPDTGFVSLG